MVWSNGPLTVYHGTDDGSAHLIVSAGVNLSAGRDDRDFGKGFYTTTYLHQAQQWANQRVLGLGGRAVAAVIAFDILRVPLGDLSHLAFINDTADFYALVAFSRAVGGPTHGCAPCYDVVYGPVSLWPQVLAIKDCDQISFHTPRGISILSPAGIAVPPRGNSLF